jgi:hypothetical protein
MKALVRTGSIFIVLIAACIIAYTVGQRRGRSDSRTELIENYAFVREIAELASLEVAGSSTFKSTNIPESEPGILSSFRKSLFEKTVTLTVPFTAKYGVNLSHDSLRIERSGDSVLKLHLPRPKLLSYELHMDRMDAVSKKGLLLAQNDAFYQDFQKKLYAQGRGQLAQNEMYLNRAADRVCSLLKSYFDITGLHTVCIFNSTTVNLQ